MLLFRLAKIYGPLNANKKPTATAPHDGVNKVVGVRNPFVKLGGGGAEICDQHVIAANICPPIVLCTW